MVIFVIVIMGFYALPNLYGEDPALQIAGKRGLAADLALVEQVKSSLDKSNVAVKSVALENNQILVRFLDTEAQIKARDIVSDAVGDNYSVALNLSPATPEWLATVGGQPMKFGLDLRGGVHFLMEVDMKAAMAKVKDGLVDSFREDLRGEKIRYRSVKESDNGVTVVFRKLEDYEKGADFLTRNYRDYEIIEDEDALTVKARMTEAKTKEVREYALQQNITIIRNRVNELGVAEPLVQRQGASHIVIQLPGVQDTARAKEILSATATLEFHMVDQEGDINNALDGRVPAGSYLLKDRDGRPYLLKKRTMLTGDHIVGANSGMDEYNRAQVNVDLDAAGGSKFSNATKNNIGKPMATVFIENKAVGKNPDGSLRFEKHEEIISVATIQARLGRSFRITGQDSPAEAHNLALLLRAGALIAPIAIVEERTIGATAGAENVQLGLQAILLGFVLVLAFMAVYYKKFGLVANVALAINLVLIVGVMSMLPGATLTLPGMAGIVLTVGMAVDANVLIFERIREEMRAGRSVQQAIHHGYDAAFSSILDANITTLIVALILFAVGTGPIKGFAITLAIGIVTSMFTAIIGTRAIVNSIWGGKRLEKLSI